MATVLTDSANYTAIANAIRAKLGVQTTYLPSEMASAIASIPQGGSGCPRGTAQAQYSYYQEPISWSASVTYNAN